MKKTCGGRDKKLINYHKLYLILNPTIRSMISSELLSKQASIFGNWKNDEAHYYFSHIPEGLKGTLLITANEIESKHIYSILKREEDFILQIGNLESTIVSLDNNELIISAPTPLHSPIKLIKVKDSLNIKL